MLRTLFLIEKAEKAARSDGIAEVKSSNRVVRVKLLPKNALETTVWEWPSGRQLTADEIEAEKAFTFTCPLVVTNNSRNIALAFSRGPSFTHYVALNGCTLSTMKASNREFDEEFDTWEKHSPQDFAKSYLTTSRSSLIGLTGSAYRVLKAIINNSLITSEGEDSLTSTSGVNMAKKDVAEEAVTGFRKPEGAVAQVHGFLDKKLEQIKAGTVSRKELIEQLEAKGLNGSTVVTQCGVWARLNAVQFARPTQAAATKSETAKAKRAAKKAVAA